MALMERVATLLRANINDLLARTEEPEKMLRQVVLDMENQLLQVKTQVAIALADQLLLQKKAADQQQAADHWRDRAEHAVSKGDDGLARAALERSLSHGTVAEAFRAQMTEQTAEADALRATYTRLQGKLADTKAQCEVLIAKHRRASVVARATQAGSADEEGTAKTRQTPLLSQIQDSVDRAEAKNQADRDLGSPDALEQRFTSAERNDRVEELLADLKSRQQRLLPTG